MPPGCLMLISSRKMCREISSGFTTARGRRSAHIPMMHGENAVCPEPTGIRYWKTRLWPSITPSATVDIITTTKPDSIISKADTTIRSGDGSSMRMIVCTAVSLDLICLPIVIIIPLVTLIHMEKVVLQQH